MKKSFVQVSTKIHSIDEENRTIDFIMSTDVIDLEDEVLTKDGWKFIKESVPMVVDHEYKAKNAIARVTPYFNDLRDLCGKAKFGTTDFANDIFTLYKEGILTDVSVGYLTQKGEFRENEEGNFIWYVLEKILLELSGVVIGANPEAVPKALADGLISQKSATKLKELENPHLPENYKKTLEKKEKKIEEMNDEEKGKLLGEWVEPMKAYRKGLKKMRKSFNMEVQENEMEGIKELEEKVLNIVQPQKPEEKEVIKKTLRPAPKVRTANEGELKALFTKPVL